MSVTHSHNADVTAMKFGPFLFFSGKIKTQCRDRLVFVGTRKQKKFTIMKNSNKKIK